MKLRITRFHEHVTDTLRTREDLGDTWTRSIGQTQGQTQAALSIELHQQRAVSSAREGKTKVEGHRGFTNAPFLASHGDDVHASPNQCASFDTPRQTRGSTRQTVLM